MSATTRRGVVRNANRVVRRLRSRVSDALYKGQLGPGNGAELDLVASQTWYNHRAL